MQISLSKTRGEPVFIATSGPDEGKTFNIIYDHKEKYDGPPIREYKKGQLQLVPNGERPECHLIIGPRGSGKSYWLAEYIKQYLKKHNYKKKVYLIAPEEDDEDEDDPLRPLKINRLKMNVMNWINNPPTLREFNNSLLCFDDCEGLRNKDIRKAVFNFKDEALLLGRKKGISVCVINHKLKDYKNTAAQNLEVDTITFFPYSGGLYQVKDYLKKECCLDKDTVQYLTKLPSRHVTVHKCMPPYFLSQDHFGFINNN